jgi:hypothetical protein
MEGVSFMTKLWMALSHALLQILRFIFVLPLNLWVKAVDMLNEQKEKNLLDFKTINGFWPFVVMLKRYMLDFLFYAISFLAYPVGFCWGLYEYVDSLISLSKYHSLSNTLELSFYALASIWILAYYTPVILSLIHDIIQLLLLPVRKYINWGSKPAQFLEIQNK